MSYNLARPVKPAKTLGLQEDSYMRRFTTYVLAVLIVASAALAASQKASTPEDLDKAMKRIGPANGAMNKAIKTMAWADAKKQVAIVEEALVDAHNFWVVKKKDDAIKMSSEAQTKLKALKATLEQPSPDSATVMTAAREFASSCLGCHKAYREQDANQQFVLKGGV
jgi:cytochrome c556